jgi:hypothetical protein
MISFQKNKIHVILKKITIKLRLQAKGLIWMYQLMETLEDLKTLSNITQVKQFYFDFFFFMVFFFN